MKKFAVVLAATALLPLAACNRTPAEQAADNLSDNLEMQADNLQAASENAADMGDTNTAEALKNASEATENRADAVETNVENTSM